MKITTASLLLVFVGVGVASVATGDESGHSLRSIDQQRLLQKDSSPEIEAGKGAVTTGAADMKNKDDTGFDKDTCKNIAEIACGGDFKELCSHLSTSSSTLGKELTSGSWTVFVPTDQAFRDIEDNVIEKFDDDKVNQLLLFHVIENQELKFDDLVCTDKVLMYNGKYSRTKCEYNLIESDRQRTPIKHQNGSGNNKMGNKPVIIRSNVQACNGIIHVVDSLLLPFTPTLIGDDDMGGDPGFGLDPTCDPSPDCVPRYGNGVQLHFCCLTDDQWEPGLIGNDDLGGDPGFGIDPNQCDPSPDCEPYWGNGQQLHFCCDDDDGIGNDDAGGDPGFGIGTIEECCVNKGGAYRPSQNADGSVSQWCDYEGTLYEGIYFWSVECEGINDDDCIEEAYGKGGSQNEDKCLECCIVHYQKRFTQCDIDYGNTDPNVPDTEFGDALQRCDQYNIRAYIMCGSKCVEGCDDSCNTDYKQCMRLCTTIYGKEGDECRLECIQDVSTCHDECHGVAMDYFDDKSPF